MEEYDMKNKNYINQLNEKFTPIEEYLIDEIIEYLTIRGIEKERLFFTDLDVINYVYGNKILITNKNTINELYENLSTNKDNIIINITNLASLIELGIDFNTIKSVNNIVSNFNNYLIKWNYYNMDNINKLYIFRDIEENHVVMYDDYVCVAKNINDAYNFFMNETGQNKNYVIKNTKEYTLDVGFKKY